jgi:hypothetical protein
VVSGGEPEMGLLGDLDCRGRRDATLRQPRVYVAKREAEAALADVMPCECCGEYEWRDWLLANETGTLVTRPEDADVVWIPFPGTCGSDLICPDIDAATRSAPCAGSGRPSFDRVWRAVKGLGPGRFATVCVRPWTWSLATFSNAIRRYGSSPPS